MWSWLLATPPWGRWASPRTPLPLTGPTQAINASPAVQAVRAAPLAAHRWASSLLQQQSLQQAAVVDAVFPGFGTEADLTWPVLSLKGEQTGEVTLGGDVFNTVVRRDILHRVVRWQLALRQQVRLGFPCGGPSRGGSPDRLGKMEGTRRAH